ncbi:Protein YIPF3 [Echinococcus granulosus]|uniref:Protein YIPF n=1 Tax=Echinococcus granulosus TaxID=6210 RepID=A0A068WWL1_ECHGR|nr:Protein YIPF3 [Echinococcus granulosus]CDS24227.1 Yip1 domain [Echinococcus granulosus]
MLPMHGDESPPTTLQRINSRSSMGPSELFSALSASVWSESKKRAESAYQNYGKIDSFRPYFDVEPKEVLGRILKSIDPRPPSSLNSGHDLYGPFMACLTLIAVLLFEMKLSDHKVQEGTLMGSAFLTCFGYWLASSGILLAICYFGKSSIAFTQILSFVGYALCSTCVVLFVCAAKHNEASETLFFVLWALVCGAAGAKMALIMWVNIPERGCRITGAVAAFALHMLLVPYLHFAYHGIVQDISNVIGNEDVIVPKAKP